MKLSDIISEELKKKRLDAEAGGGSGGSGAGCKGSVSSLRAKAKKYSGEKGKMYHWCANMKAGKRK